MTSEQPSEPLEIRLAATRARQAVNEQQRAPRTCGAVDVSLELARAGENHDLLAARRVDEDAEPRVGGGRRERHRQCGGLAPTQDDGAEKAKENEQSREPERAPPHRWRQRITRRGRSR